MLEECKYAIYMEENRYEAGCHEGGNKYCAGAADCRHIEEFEQGLPCSWHEGAGCFR